MDSKWFYIGCFLAGVLLREVYELAKKAYRKRKAEVNYNDEALDEALEGDDEVESSER